MTLVQRTEINLVGNPNRVLCRLFIPGEEELIRGTSRARELIARVACLSDEQVSVAVKETMRKFSTRHPDFEQQLNMHFLAVSGLIDDPASIAPERRRLLGALLTQEYAFESTAYFNPSIVPHPDQTGVPRGYLRFVMSVRSVGEGHMSTLIFRTGMIGPDASIVVDPASVFATTRATRYTVLRNRLVLKSAADAGIDTADLEFILGMLPDKFTPEELKSTLSQLAISSGLLPDHDALHHHLAELASGSYEVDFPEDTALSERVLWPTASDERRGLEDARFVLFTEEDGSTHYRATYTGFDGTGVVSRLLETDDFRTFSSMPLTGKAVMNKGVAFFPRKVQGRYCALSRWDRESNSIAFSDDGYHWNEGETFHSACETWELIHVGNCGSPIETREGWLVLTHGAGPMREYAIGAMLLDRDDPSVVLAAYPGALLSPTEEERDGYVPNVVYSCGSLIHHETLVIPYGISDCRTSFATVDLHGLMTSMQEVKGRRVLV
ncbi:MAG: glycoside hydrolase family 130 protein [Candidatus Nanopelagicales bacterium]